MENKNICPLVQDLLPSLADGIASPESKHMMLEHMKTCDICRKMYENMCPVKEEILPEEKEDIPVETFARKLKIRKFLLWSIVCAVILALAGVTVYAVAVNRYANMHYQEEVFIRGEGFLLGTQSQPVNIAVDGALYHNMQRAYSEDDPDGHTTFVWDTFAVSTADGAFLFDDKPYAASLPGWIPLEDNGTIRSLLGTYNEPNMTKEFSYYGQLYSMNRMNDFLLYKFNEDGSFYIVCYPCRSETEAVRKVQNYVEAFGLQDSYLWEYVSGHYADMLE